MQLLTWDVYSHIFSVSYAIHPNKCSGAYIFVILISVPQITKTTHMSKYLYEAQEGILQQGPHISGIIGAFIDGAR